MISIQNNMLAMNAERHFQINGKKNAKITEKLWVEIDRIDQSTEFNEQPVFGEYEPSYYQLIGNRRWNDNQELIDEIDDALEQMSSRRSIYGAIQNRLEHTINNNNNVIENTQASESAVRDADIAGNVMEHSVNNILRQASVAMLTQAGQTPQMILQLLH